MAIREIIKYPAAVLKTRTKEVTSFDGNLAKLLDDMRQTMYAANGLGLAAPQINVGLRVAVMDVSDNRLEPLELVNPKIIEMIGEVPSEEGCLSIPEYRETITRAKEIVVKAQNRKGEPFEVKWDGISSICAQHEIDHLDGVLFVDRMSRLKREIFLKWLKKRGPFT